MMYMDFQILEKLNKLHKIRCLVFSLCTFLNEPEYRNAVLWRVVQH